ncbi:MAG TPA: hypothetical protein PL110_14495 [Candidatus Eremiobacteraeota bacterium]|nr:MAG: hypothetical protein BWY64_00919 [bacterium ADurb.Bin363]HPZ09315.1 hypothetical protein [Candidatus Eremiobacteraeota bacterium]
MRSLLFVLLFYLLLTFSVFAQNITQYYISPGKGIEGLLYLGQDMGKMFDQWGASDTIQEGYGVLIYDYKRYQLTFGAEIYTNKVVMIFINTYIYKTADNICVGSSMSDVLRIYGSSYRIQRETAMGGNAIFYDSIGIGFGINNNSVVSIAVYYPQR